MQAGGDVSSKAAAMAARRRHRAEHLRGQLSRLLQLLPPLPLRFQLPASFWCRTRMQTPTYEQLLRLLLPPLLETRVAVSSCMRPNTENCCDERVATNGWRQPLTPQPKPKTAAKHGSHAFTGPEANCHVQKRLI